MSERDYIKGATATARRLLLAVARELGHDDPLAKAAARIAERSATVEALRELCAKYGDNDWPDNLYLPDVIEKHLRRLGKAAKE